MNGVSPLVKGMFSPSCLIEFLSCWAAAGLLVGVFYIGARWDALVRQWRRNAKNAAQQDPPSPLSTFLVFLLLAVGCVWAYFHFGAQRTDALTLGYIDIVRGRTHNIHRLGSAEFDRSLSLLLFCQWLMVFFAAIAVIGAIKGVRHARDS